MRAQRTCGLAHDDAREAARHTGQHRQLQRPARRPCEPPAGADAAAAMFVGRVSFVLAACTENGVEK